MSQQIEIKELWGKIDNILICEFELYSTDRGVSSRHASDCRKCRLKAELGI